MIQQRFAVSFKIIDNDEVANVLACATLDSARRWYNCRRYQCISTYNLLILLLIFQNNNGTLLPLYEWATLFLDKCILPSVLIPSCRSAQSNSNA